MDNCSCTFTASGMHCPSCELVIERKLRNFPGITSIRASLSEKTVTIVHEGTKPSPDLLNQSLTGTGYILSDPEQAVKPTTFRQYLKPSAFVIATAAAFYLLFRTGVFPMIMVSESSSYGAFLLFGLLAGISSCAALTGGIVLACTARWQEKRHFSEGFTGSAAPHFLFNGGRILAYALFGALLGYAGETVKISAFVYNSAILAVSILMISLALQMLGFSVLSKVNIPLPERISRFFSKIVSGSMTVKPFNAGILTLFIPCGFTLIAEGAAILSGNPLQGMIIMACFVIGTMPALLGIGILSSKLSMNGKTAPLFLKTSGGLVLVFVIWNLSMQFGPQAGITGPRASGSLSDAPAAFGTIHISTVYSDARDISPNTFTVKRGQTVRFVVDPLETSYGCMSTILVPGLWNRPEPIVKGKKVVMQFTPMQTGSYKITCAMGVPRGAIIVK
ncbi:MAG: hypothetical protein HGA62_00265 [Chlorobiaceae bacterium]|nr:hypothetical protein [Chlorobiaceae bacterium]NTV61425.1 hypothetical protein [Chlorobiaceae bacterium]